MLTQRDARVIETLPDIKVPSLVVVGADDTPFLAASDYMAAKIPGAKKVVIPAAGHAVNIDQPQAFIDAVLPFPRRPRHGTAKTGLMRISCRRLDDYQSASTPGLAQHLPPDWRPPPPPLLAATLSNNTPLLAFRIGECDANGRGEPAQLCQRPSGQYGVFFTFRNLGGGGLFHQQTPALSAIPQRPPGRLEGRLGPQLDVAVGAPRHRSSS